MQCCVLDWILEQKEDINEIIGEIGMKSIILDNSPFLSFNQCTMVL